MFFRKNKRPKMRVVTRHIGLSQIDECLPKAGYHYFPAWVKNLKREALSGGVWDKGTIKNCPVFAEYLTQGVVIPMWCDTLINVSGDNISIETANNDFYWESHSPSQYLDHLPSHVNKDDYAVLKAVCPWSIITSRGYSSYQQDLYYHHNDDFFVLPGNVNTDHHHEVNPQVLVKKNKDIFIPRGIPFVWYIPYKREKYNIDCGLSTQEENNMIIKSRYDVATKFTGGYKQRAKQFKK